MERLLSEREYDDVDSFNIASVIDLLREEEIEAHTEGRVQLELGEMRVELKLGKFGN